MVKITALPAEGGRPVTKSSAMWDHGLEGVGRGWSCPAGDWFVDLFLAQTGQAETYSRASLVKEGHQK